MEHPVFQSEAQWRSELSRLSQAIATAALVEHAKQGGQLTEEVIKYVSVRAYDQAGKILDKRQSQTPRELGVIHTRAA